METPEIIPVMELIPAVDDGPVESRLQADFLLTVIGPLADLETGWGAGTDLLAETPSGRNR